MTITETLTDCNNSSSSSLNITVYKYDIMDDNNGLENTNTHQQGLSPLTISSSSINNTQIHILSLPIEIIFNIFVPCNLESIDKLNLCYFFEQWSLDTSNRNEINYNDNNNNSYYGHQLPYESQSILIQSIVNFSTTCKYFNQLFKDQGFWKSAYRSRFSYCSMVDLDQRCLSLLPPQQQEQQQPISSSKDIGKSKSISLVAKEYSNNNNIWKKRFISRPYPWDLDKFHMEKEVNGVHSSGVTCLELDDNYVFSGSHDSTVTIYKTENLRPIVSLEGHSYTIWALKSDGNTLYSGSNDTTIRLWDLNTFGQSISKNNNTNRNDGEESPDRDLLQCKGILNNGAKVFSLELWENTIFSTCGENINVWDTKSLKKVHTLMGHGGGVNTIRVKDMHLISGSSDKTVRIWDMNTMQCLATSEEQVARVLSIALVDRNTFFVGSNTNIRIWDLREPKYIHSPLQNGHRWEVWQLETHAGFVFSGSFDHTIKAWDIRNYKNVYTSQHAHKGYIHALKSSAYHLFSGSADKNIKVWSI